MAYSPFGYSLPQLAVSGYGPTTAAWGGPITIDVTVQNQGASSLVEPLDLAPGSTANTLNTPAGVSTNSTADAPPTTVDVYASSKAGKNSNLIEIGTVSFPNGIAQNSTVTIPATINLPAKPAGYGNKLFLTLVVNNDQTILQESESQNVYRVPNPVKIANNALPDLQVVGFDIPSSLQPGDVIAPTIRIANLGTANTDAQGPVTVELVASLTKNFGPGDSVVGSFVINSLPGISGVATQATTLVGGDNLIPPDNEYTDTLSPVKLPTKPGTYYLGIVIDPTHAINQTYAPKAALRDVVVVGPRDPNLAPTSLLVTTNGTVPVFPALPSSIIGPTGTSTTPVLFPYPTTSNTIPTDSPIVRAASVKSKKKG
jgi:hypothetical protein